MNELSTEDWKSLERLAGNIGFSVERIALLKSRLDGSLTRPGAPYVLFAATPNAGLELLLARWIHSDAAEDLKKSGERPLVIGVNPAVVRPKAGSVWPGRKWSQAGTGHIVALRAHTPLSRELLASISSLGFIETAIIVTRLSQPLSMTERQLAQSLSTVVATARALIVGIPGEEPSESELAEVSAYAVHQIRNAGFTGGRCLGAGVWFTDGKQRPGSVADVRSFMRADPAEIASGRSRMAEAALSSLLTDMEAYAAKGAGPKQPKIPPEECDRLCNELAGYLSALGAELNRWVKTRGPESVDLLRTYAYDAIRGWASYTSVEGHWLKYVERLNPGAEVELFKEAESALALLHYQPGTQSSIAPALPSAPALSNRLTVLAQRLGIAFVFGIAAYIAVNSLLLDVTPNGKAGLLVSLLSYIGLLLGGFAGYGLGHVIFRTPAPEPPETSCAERKAPIGPVFTGWEQVERRLTSWFRQRMAGAQTSPAQQLSQLIRKFAEKEYPQ